MLKSLKDKLINDSRPAAAVVPDHARALIQAVLNKRQLLPEALINEIAKQEAMEILMSEVLHDSFREFSDKIFDFIVSMVPSLVRKPLSAMKSEFERRLEPELKKFLALGSRQALKRGAAYVLAHQDDPAFVKFRVGIFEWILTQPIKDIAMLADDQALEAGEAIFARLQE